MKLVFSFCMLLLSVMLFSSACGKSDNGNGGGGGTTEETISAQTTPAVGSVEIPAIGPNFPLVVTINSKLPASGVKIEVNAKPEAGGAAFFTTQVNSSILTNNFTILNTPSATPSIVEVNITSLSQSTNKWSGTYRYSRK